MDRIKPHAWDDPDFTEERDEIIKIIADKLKVAAEDIKATSHLIEDLGADSIDVADIVMAIEDRYGLEVSATSKSATTVGDIMNIIRTALTPPAQED